LEVCSVIRLLFAVFKNPDGIGNDFRVFKDVVADDFSIAALSAIDTPPVFWADTFWTGRAITAASTRAPASRAGWKPLRRSVEFFMTNFSIDWAGRRMQPVAGTSA
jgi:hypothetical protein